MAKSALFAGVFFSLIAVVLGAFGAHALKEKFSADVLAIWQTAVQYQFYHALALIGLGIWLKQVGIASNAIVGCFIAGILIFSGSLYLLSFTGIKVLGAVTPIGGTLFIIAWVLWLIKLMKH